MDEKSLEILEFPQIRAILAGYTSFSASHELASALQPLTDYDHISLLLGQSAEARAEAEREIERAREQIGAGLAEARESLRPQAELLAREAAARVLGRALS